MSVVRNDIVYKMDKMARAANLIVRRNWIASCAL